MRQLVIQHSSGVLSGSIPVWTKHLSRSDSVRAICSGSFTEQFYYERWLEQQPELPMVYLPIGWSTYFWSTRLMIAHMPEVVALRKVEQVRCRPLKLELGAQLFSDKRALKFLSVCEGTYVSATRALYQEAVPLLLPAAALGLDQGLGPASVGPPIVRPAFSCRQTCIWSSYWGFGSGERGARCELPSPVALIARSSASGIYHCTAAQLERFLVGLDRRHTYYSVTQFAGLILAEKIDIPCDLKLTLFAGGGDQDKQFAPHLTVHPIPLLAGVSSARTAALRHRCVVVSVK